MVNGVPATPLDDLIALRTQELKRRIDGLDRELKTWNDRCNTEPRLGPNLSQVRAVSVLVRTFIEKQKGDLAGLAGPAFATNSFVLADDIALTQGVWDFFRDKLELRFNPDFQRRIAIADTIAWDCYDPVLNKAGQLGIIESVQKREPPLTYLSAALFASTLQRHRRVNKGGSDVLRDEALPIPVIELPWDSLENLWELLSIPHEVGHDIETDLGIEDELSEVLAAALDKAGVTGDDADRWNSWRSELFADLVALQLVGPPFAEYLLSLLLSPDKRAFGAEQDEKHPTPVLRILLVCTAIEALLEPAAAGASAGVKARTQAAIDNLAADAAEIEARWRAVYPQTPARASLAAVLGAIVTALMDTGLTALQGLTPRSLMPYLLAGDERIRAGAPLLAAGQVPAGLTKALPRFCLAAARRGATLIAATGKRGDALSTALATLDGAAQRYVEANTEEGVRALPSAARETYFASFADKLRAARAKER